MSDPGDRVERELALAREALDDARTLLEDGSDAGTISRAYYACYHAAKAVLLADGHEPDTHAGLVGTFGQHVVNDGPATTDDGRFLNRLNTYRQAADYGYEDPEVDPERIVERSAAFVVSMEDALDAG